MAVRARGAGISGRRQRAGGPRGVGRGLRRGALDPPGRDRPRRPDAGAQRGAQQPLLLARARRLQRPRARRAAQPVRRPRGQAERHVTIAELGPNPLAQGLERLPVAPTNVVIFGATGDLARRKLLPAIYNLAHEGALPGLFNLIGVSRGEMTHEAYRELAAESIRRFSRTPPDESVLTGLLSELRYVSGSFDGADTYETLAATLDEL